MTNEKKLSKEIYETKSLNLQVDNYENEPQMKIMKIDVWLRNVIKVEHSKSNRTTSFKHKDGTFTTIYHRID